MDNGIKSCGIDTRIPGEYLIEFSVRNGLPPLLSPMQLPCLCMFFMRLVAGAGDES